MNILLFGKNGQVGQALQHTLLPLGQVIALGRSEADLADPLGLEGILHTHAPKIIVNAAAYTAVDQAEQAPKIAHAVNADALRVMADYAQKNRALLVHYSTDYVFDGEKPTPYVETDLPNPQSVYGTSKRDGEAIIAQSGCNTLIFRTSWVFAATGKNFVTTILRLANTKIYLDVIADQHGAPTAAELIAELSARAIMRYQQKTLAGGLYHLTAAGCTSWHGFAHYIVTRALENGAVLLLKPAQIRAIPTEAYPLPAKRPKNSCLDTSRLSHALGLTLPDWTFHVNRVIDRLSQIPSIPDSVG